MATVQTEARKKSGIHASPLVVATEFKAALEVMRNPELPERVVVTNAAKALEAAGFDVRALRPGLEAARGALAGWTDERLAASFELYLSTRFPSRAILDGLHAVLAVPEIGDRFKLAQALVDRTLEYRRSHGHRDHVGEDILTATVVDYAAAAWVGRRLTSIIDFVEAEHRRGAQILSTSE